MKSNLCCLLQNRLGALDRVLGALTYRGFVPDQFVSNLDARTGHLQVMVSFECENEKTLEKLMKALEKQVYVLEVQQVTLGTRQEPLPLVAHNITPMFSPAYARRRV